MSDIQVQYVNEVRCRVVARREIMISLKDEFSFFANGYKFHPLYKQGKWSGKISMIDKNGLFYSGLLKSLLKHCKEKGLSIVVDEISRYMPTPIDDSIIDKLSSYIKFPPYDYQQRSVKEALSKRKLLILSPTSSGKSLISYMLYRYCVDNNIKLLINVPSTSLCEQLYSDFKSYVSDDHNVDDYVHTLYSGKDKNTDKMVVISTWQTSSNMDPEWFKQFGFYIVDEAHTATSKELSAIIDHLGHCPYRIGMTGTLNGTSIHEIEIHARFGEIFKMVTTRELIDRGIVTDIGINMVHLKYNADEVKRMNAFCKNDYQREIDYIINSEARNNYMVDLALSLPNTTLMLFNRVEEHGMVLMEMLENRAVENMKKIFFISGKIKVKERERIRLLLDADLPKYHRVTLSNGTVAVFDAEFISYEYASSFLSDSTQIDQINESNTYLPDGYKDQHVTSVETVEGAHILLASYGTLAVGVNIKNLHNLIFGHPFKSKIINLQSIGRILRKSAVKNKVYLYDLMDDFKKGKKENHVYKHATERLALYEAEEFDYDIIQHPL